jgi:hypothetical protein
MGRWGLARLWAPRGRLKFQPGLDAPLGLPMASASRARLGIAKQAERAWHAYIERKIREMLKGSPR